MALAIFSLNINDLKYIGIFIFFSKNVLDNVDGFIAREKKLISLTGKKLDEVSGHVYYYSIFLSLIFHSYYLTDNIIILFFGFFIILLDLINLIYNKQEKNSIKKNKSKLFKKIYQFLKIINFDGRTFKTDFVILIILIEILSNIYLLSTFLIYLFFIPKILRNLHYLYRKIL